MNTDIIKELEQIIEEHMICSGDDYIDGYIDGILTAIKKIEELTSI